MVAGIGDVEVVVRVEFDAVGAAEQGGLRRAAVAHIAGFAALTGYGVYGAVEIDVTHAVVEGVGEKDSALGVNGHVTGPVQGNCERVSPVFAVPRLGWGGVVSDGADGRASLPAMVVMIPGGCINLADAVVEGVAR